MTKEQWIVYALRCSTTPASKCKGDSCPYYLLEDMTDTEFEALSDVEKDGRKYCSSCDIDKMSLDAAQAIEDSISVPFA